MGTTKIAQKPKNSGKKNIKKINKKYRHKQGKLLYRYTSATELEAAPITAGINTYGGGGYVFRIKGFIGDVEEKIQMLKEQNWIDNRTRAVFVEFSVYNAQVETYYDSKKINVSNNFPTIR